MKIAAITDDGQTISQHFGRARYYKVFTVDDGKLTGSEMRDKAGHHSFAGEDDQHHDHDHEHGEGSDPRGHGFGAQADARHMAMVESITDCDVVLVRGMGRGAYLAMEAAGLKPIVTDIGAIEEAVQAFLDGEIVDHTERLH
jgi:predicted Fe-Mo cluster-binding NifX family protein